VLLAALRDLQWRRRRFIIAVLGTALVFAMTLVLAGLSAAFSNEVDRTVETTGADAWVIAPGASGPFNSSSVLGAEVLPAVKEMPGVEDADPFIALGGSIPDGSSSEKITMIGAVPGGVGSPTVDDGRAPREPGEVAVGQRLGKDIGDEVEFGGKTFRVVGTVNGSSLFGGMPNVFMTIEDVQAVTFGGAPLYTSVAVRGSPRGEIEGAHVVSISDTKSDLLEALGSGIQTINVVAVLLWIVAACIVGSVIYLSALERVRDFAVFKATGTGTGALLSGLALQAVIVSLVAALVGALVALLLAPTFPMPAEIPTVAFLVLPVVAVVVGGLASLAGLRRAVTVSPALAFGGA
jgi:putative ABC transport system permease protein